MIIDCDGCAVRDLACGECVVTALLSISDAHDGADDGAAPLLSVEDDERRALAVLADSGLVPRLRLVPLGLPDERPQRSA